MNTRLKHFLENALLTSGAARIAGRSRRGRTLVLAYHNVLPDGEALTGSANLHLPQRDFAQHLDILGASHDVVPIGEIFEASSRSTRPRVVITFDDAYAGCLTAGVDELSKRGMPATIFTAPGLLGLTPWWDELAEPVTGVVPDDVRDQALTELRGQQEMVVGSAPATTHVVQQRRRLPLIGTEPQLAAAAATPGITLGSHTWSHPNLCALDEAEIQSELTRPLEWLRSRFDSAVPWVSYPYGFFNSTVARLAANAGYRGAFRIDGGWLPPQESRQLHALPRFGVPFGLSLSGFRLRLAGL